MKNTTEQYVGWQAPCAKPELNDAVAISAMVSDFRTATVDEFVTLRPDLARQLREAEAQALSLGRYPVVLVWRDATETVAFLQQSEPTARDLLASYLKARLGAMPQLATIASAVTGASGRPN
jgi:hypothetical protein